MDLVLGPPTAVAQAVHSQVVGFAEGEQLTHGWVVFESLEGIFSSVSAFTNYPTVLFVLPTHSAWSVLWNNCHGCDGFDSLCWNLTSKHGFATMHWRASDQDAVMQAGASFTFRRRTDSGIAERSVYCCKNDGRWEFHANGDPLPEEDVHSYSLRRKHDRLNELKMLALLSRIGARPWDSSFYKFGEAFRIERISYPSTISSKLFQDFAVSKATK
jgi:hypothetical protein